MSPICESKMSLLELAVMGFALYIGIPILWEFRGAILWLLLIVFLALNL